MTFNDVMDQNDIEIAFVSVALWEIFGVDKTLSLPAKISLLAIGHGMRLVVDQTKKREARLVVEPDFKQYMKHTQIDVPKHVAEELISSGLLKKMDRPGADWWCMVV